MKIAYYPGCSLHSTGSEFDTSMKQICTWLDIELEEVEGWICCGTTAAHASSRMLSLALPVANLSLVEQSGTRNVVVPCASCFARLKTGHHETTSDPRLMERVNRLVDRPYKGTVDVVHPLSIFSTKETLDRLEDLAKEDLSHLRVACYYGCLLTRPPERTRLDRPEYPMLMDKILGALGITTLDWDYKTRCCGMAFSLTETEVVHKLTGEILEEAKAVGANAISVACPLCHSNLDTRQGEIEKTAGKEFKLPVFYFTQLMGLALGISPKKLAIGKHLVSADGLVGAGRPARAAGGAFS